LTAPISTGLLALPYDWQEAHSVNPEWNIRLLDEFEAHPAFVSVPSSQAQRREIGAQLLTNPTNRIWGVWRSGELLGVVVLTRVIEGLDALLHFMFLDQNLVGKRTLLTHFLGYCFSTLKYRRLSAEVPEDADKLLRFYRTLGFRFEGEGKAAGAYPVASASPSAGGTRVQRPATTIAKLGSRMDSMYWREDRWIDVIRLRLLREEWEQGHADSTNRSSRSTYRRGPDRESGRPQAGDHHPPAA
jgi:RimJ/RimL family protein N-acetyltransferase